MLEKSQNLKPLGVIPFFAMKQAAVVSVQQAVYCPVCSSLDMYNESPGLRISTCQY